MTPARLAAAIAAVITALLLQATLVAPLTVSVPISLPAVLVAVVALQCGPGTGMSLGFSAGLLADLGSTHPAGVLALAWLGLGLAGGMLAQPARSVFKQAGLAALGATIAAAGVTTLLALLGPSGSRLDQVLPQTPWTLLGDAVLALAVGPAARAFLASAALRPAQSSQPRRVLPRG
jgi:cell shape-determining protein MreD